MLSFGTILINVQERLDHRPLSRKRFGSFVKSPRLSNPKRVLESMASKRDLAVASRNLASAEARKSQLLDDKIDSIGASRPILQSLLHPNDQFVRDDYFGPHDSYDVELLSPPKPDAKKEAQVKSRRTGPRLAGFLPWRSGPKFDWNSSAEVFFNNRQDFKDETEKQDETMTTLLHEACRLAHPEFVRLLLSQGGNPNIRNGQQRTALHMVAGGLLEHETQFLETSDVGIRTPDVTLQTNEIEDVGDKKLRKTAARAVNRLFLKIKEREPGGMPLRTHPTSPAPLDCSIDNCASQRMDTLLTILSWFHPDDDTPAAGEGPTINSVDLRGRTALHYSAELGRKDICLTILTSFGAILTIVDDAGHTPGELASEQNHPDLAAQLDARALLYTDPYGLDEDLFASVWQNSSDDQTESARKSKKKKKKKKKRASHSKLAPPFSWFETWTIESVRSERRDRVAKLFGQMQNDLACRQELRESMEFIFNHGVHDSTEFASQDDAVCCSATKGSDAKIVGMFIHTAPADESVIDDSGTKPPAIPDMGVGDASLHNISDPKTDESSSPPLISEAVPCEALALELFHVASDEEQLIPPSQSSLESQDLPCESTSNETMKHLLPATLESAEMKADVIGTKAQSEFDVLSKSLQLVHAEKFVAFHSWNIEASLQAFKEDPFMALKSAGVDMISGANTTDRDKHDDPTSARMCLICCEEVEGMSDNWIELTGCDHSFCAECLGDYVSECAKSKECGVTIKCPHHECSAFMSFEEIEKLAPSPDVYESLQKAADDICVATADDLCFCPHPGCDRIVQRVLPSFVRSAKLDCNLIGLCGAVCAGSHSSTGPHTSLEDSSCPLTYDGVPDANYQLTSNAVQPNTPHRFCFSCGSETIHWPINCEALEQWKEKIAKEVGEVDNGEESVDGVTFNDVAQRLWMRANTRPCPKCKAPIEKNDDCNHMTACSNRNCRHEFCWICREDWKIHNTETGGFFRCNRWQADDNQKEENSEPLEQRALSRMTSSDALDSPEVSYGTALHSSRVAWQKSKDMGLFLHNYRRWTGHAESSALERRMADTVCVRLAPVVEAAIDFNGQLDFDFRGEGLSFIHAAFTELLECRSLLQHSYAFAFFRYPITFHIRRDRLSKSKEREKAGFELLQSELEMLTEQLSDIVARKHLRATQMQIMFLTKNACQKRSEFTSLMLSLLNQQLKEKAERASRVTDRPTVDRIRLEMGSNFEFDGREILTGHRYRPPRTYEFDGRGIDTQFLFPERRNYLEEYPRRRLNGNHPHSTGRRDLLVDSDDDDDFRWPPRMPRTHFPDEDSTQAALLPRAYFQFGSHDMRLTGNELPRFQNWACDECTYMNAGGRRCAMCGQGTRQ